MTLREHLRGGRDRLLAAGVDADEAALDAEILARDAAGMDRAGFIASLGETAPEGFGPAYDAALARREAREPMAYIRGRQEFWGRDFLVTPAVLIPRPETELIIEEALAAPFQRVLDIGTGSGCLAITLALENEAVPVELTLPASTVASAERHGPGDGGQGRLIVATDISEAALAVARANADRLLDSSTRRRVAFRHGAYAAGADGRFDLIVSNPPYVTAGDYAALQPEVRNFEPASALVSGEDGLDDIREIIRLVPHHLVPGGRLLMEIGYGQAEAVRSFIGAQRDSTLVRIREDLQGIPRVAVVTGRRG